MPEDLHELLRTPLLRPPHDFAERVLSAITAGAGDSPTEPRQPAGVLGQRGRDIVEWLAVAATVLLGLPQLAMYLFGVWTVSGAG